MKVSDLEIVSAIERVVTPYPWTLGVFAGCLKAGYRCRLLEISRTVAGYGVLSHGAGDAHILNLAIEPAFRREGHGRLILEDLLAIATEQQVEKILLEVRVDNSAAISLYRSAGFDELYVRKAYYRDGPRRTDGIVMVREGTN